MSQSPSDLQPVMSMPLRWTVRVLAWTAFGLSAYLAAESIGHTPVAGCAAGETVDCKSVLNSQWSMWLGLPVAVGGLACYATLASLSLLTGPRRPLARRWIGSLILMLSVVAGGAGLWFIALQLFVIHKICLFCMGVHSCGVAIAALVLWTMVIRPGWAYVRARICQPDAQRAVDRQVLIMQSARATSPSYGDLSASRFDGAPSIGLALGGALGALALLVGGQILFPPETYTVHSVTLAQTIEMDAGEKPAVRDEHAASQAVDTDPVRRPPAATRAAAEPATDVSPAGKGEDAVGGRDRAQSGSLPAGSRDRGQTGSLGRSDSPAAAEPVVAAPQVGTAERSADRFAAEVDQAAGNDDFEDFVGAASNKTPDDALKAADDKPVADLPPAETDGLEPVVPVSATGVRQDATTAGWSSAAGDLLGQTPAHHERRVAFLDNRLKLDMSKHPVLGSRDAPHVIVELMSYHCPHCRTMHRVIQEGLKRYDGQLAVVEMIVPLEMGCNKQITNPKYSHRGSCALTRLSLAMAAIDPTAFAGFHDWLLASPKKPPSPEKAAARAYQIVDRDRLRAMALSEHTAWQIESYIELYLTLSDLSEERDKTLGLPVQIVGNMIVSGEVGAEGLYRAWEENLGLRPPASTAVDGRGALP